MGANMQSDSYLTGSYFTMDLNGNVNTCSWPQISGYGYHGLSSLFLSNHQLGYTKEVLKKIMVEHEAIFKDQVHELHRLYERQRDLMVEMKRNKLYNNDLQVKTTGSSFILSQISSGYGRRKFQVPNFPWKPVVYSQPPDSGIEKVLSPLIQVKSVSACPGPVQTDFFFESKCKKIGKKLLDLELPADEYIDSEEELPLKNKEVPLVPQERFLGRKNLDSLPIENVSAAASLSRRTKIMADLNEPLMLVEESASLSDDLVHPSQREEINLEYPTYSDDNGQIRMILSSSPKAISEEKTFLLSKSLCTTFEQISENEFDRNLLCAHGRIDLNKHINEDEDGSSPTPSLLTQINLEAPASPDNYEFSPPRAKSDDNQPQICYPISEQDDGYLQLELVQIAAEALISISSTHVQVPSKDETYRTCCESLHLFADIVCSVIGDQESENAGDHEELSPDCVDYFEAMTLKLSETNPEEYLLKSNDKKAEQTLPLKGRPRKGRRRKDFQSEILPSLTSLSRYEVTEDLQTFGGLMEAAERNGGRNGWGRGRRRSCTSGSNVTGTIVGSLIKQLPTNRDLCVEEGGFLRWGKIRPRRGQRCPASNPQLILGQV